MSDFEALYLVLIIIQMISPYIHDYLKNEKSSRSRARVSGCFFK